MGFQFEDEAEHKLLDLSGDDKLGYLNNLKKFIGEGGPRFAWNTDELVPAETVALTHEQVFKTKYFATPEEVATQDVKQGGLWLDSLPPGRAGHDQRKAQAKQKHLQDMRKALGLDITHRSR